MSGVWVFVCGASGAGKDSVMHWAAERLGGSAGIGFARRMVTREPHAGSDHDAVTPGQFAQLREASGLAWEWHAHGFAYGIAVHYAKTVQGGGVVVVNGSREHANALAGRPDVRVVQIVADAQVLAQRLQQRGRDAPHAVADRMARNTQFSQLHTDCTIVNEHSVEQAGQKLVHYLQALSTP